MRSVRRWSVHAAGLLILMGALLTLALVTASDTVVAEDAADQEFSAWYTTTMEKVEVATNQMATAIENFDCMTVEVWASTGYNDATRALGELDGYSVSAELQPVQQHLKLALEQYKSACYYTELGAMQYDADYLEQAAGHVKSAITHFEAVDASGLLPPAPLSALNRLQGNLEYATQVLRGAQQPGASATPTPGAPGYGVLAVLSGLLLVTVYLVHRRVSH
ncbi:MAG TPA: hypothetical protein ENN68_04915 [Methanomicrobia archaeon]|nr:hypothetical protein [Methanomicrobia archaeon]